MGKYLGPKWANLGKYFIFGTKIDKYLGPKWTNISDQKWTNFGAKWADILDKNGRIFGTKMGKYMGPKWGNLGPK